MKIRLMLVFALIPAISFAQRDAVPYQVIQTKTDLFTKEKTGDTEVIYPGNWQHDTEAAIYALDEDALEGYVVGTNIFGDLAKGQHFKVEEPYDIHGAFFWVGILKGTTGKVDFCIWSFDEEPVEKIVSVGLPVSEISVLKYAAESFYVAFDPPVRVESDYLIGIDISEIGTSEIALYTSLDGDGGGLDLTWEQWSDGDWYSILSTYELDIDIAIFPVIMLDSEDPNIPELQVTAVVNRHASCFGGSDGQATAEATGGVEPYTWLWNNGQTTDVAVDLSEGSYQVTVNDAKGNSADATVYITQPTMLSVTVSTSNSATIGGNEGSATANVTGGTPPYSFSWDDDNLQQTYIATFLTAGIYMFSVSDDNGCITSAPAIISNPELYPDIDFDGLAIRYKSGSLDIIPIQDIRAISFLTATSVHKTEPAVPVSNIITVINYPNPFTNNTIIEFTLDHPGDADILIYDLNGRIVRIFRFEDCSTGMHALTWDGKDQNGQGVNSGVYILRLVLDNRVSVRRMLLIN